MDQKQKNFRLKRIKRQQAIDRLNKHGKAGPHSSKKGKAGYDRKREKQHDSDSEEDVSRVGYRDAVEVDCADTF